MAGPSSVGRVAVVESRPPDGAIPRRDRLHHIHGFQQGNKGDATKKFHVRHEPQISNRPLRQRHLWTDRPTTFKAGNFLKNFLKIELKSFAQIAALVEDLIIVEVWREEILPHLLRDESATLSPLIVYAVVKFRVGLLTKQKQKWV